MNIKQLVIGSITKYQRSWRNHKNFPRLSWHSKFLLAQILPALIAMLITFLVVFAIVQDRMLVTAHKAATDVNQQVTNMMDYVWLMTLSQVNVLNNDAVITGWLSRTGSPDNLLEAEIQQKLMRAKDSNPLIWSLYAYNAAQDRLILSYSRPSHLNNFPDRKLVKFLTGPNMKERTFFPRQAIESYANRLVKFNVITAIIPSDYPGSALIINIAVDNDHQYDFASDSNIEQLLGTTLATNPISHLMVIDGAGAVFFDRNTHQFGHSAPRISYITHILGSKSMTGSFTSKISGEKCLVNFTTSKYLGWKIINVIPYHALLAQIDFLRNIILSVCICICLAIILFSFFYSGNMTRPVKNLVQQAKEYLKDTLDASNSKNDEFGTVRQALHVVAAKAEALALEAQTNRLRLHEELIKNLLMGIPAYGEETEPVYGELQELLQGPVLVMVWEPDIKPFQALSDETTYDGVQMKMERLTKIKNQINESFNPDWRHFSVITNQEQLAVIISGEDLKDNAFRGILKERLHSIQMEIMAILDKTVTVGLGPVVPNLDHMKQSFDNAVNAAAARFKLGHGQIIEYPNGSFEDASDFDYPKEMERLLLEGIRLGNLNQVQETLQRFITHVIPYSDAEIVLSISQLAFSSARVFDELALTHKIGASINKRSLKKDLDQLQTLTDISDYLTEWYCHNFARFDKGRFRRRNEVIEKIKSLIADQYHHPELTLQQLATAVSLSPSHIRALFREITGDTLADYLVEYRLQKAAALLVQTEKPVLEIATAVGLSSANYFHNIFRRRFGVTPLEYRRHYRDKIRLEC